MKSDRVVWFPIYIKEKGTTFEKELEKTAGIIFDRYGVEKFRRIEVGEILEGVDYVEGVPVEFSEDNVGKGWAYFIFKDDNTKRRDLI